MSAEGTQAIDRAFTLLSCIVRDGGASTIAAIARANGLPVSTVHRMVGRMAAHGLLVRIGRGRYCAGLSLAGLAARADWRIIAAAAARPLLRRLMRHTGRTAHLGILEADMVTYLVKEAPSGTRLLTRETMQLEAYCSAIGKVLLARLPPDARDAYLRQDSFVALTPNTIVRPEVLRQHLADVAANGFALDQEEIAPAVYCVAVPVPGPIAMAISAAGAPPSAAERDAVLVALRGVAETLANVLHGKEGVLF